MAEIVILSVAFACLLFVCEALSGVVGDNAKAGIWRGK